MKNCSPGVLSRKYFYENKVTTEGSDICELSCRRFRTRFACHPTGRVTYSTNRMFEGTFPLNSPQRFGNKIMPIDNHNPKS